MTVNPHGTRLRAVPAMALGFAALGLLHALVGNNALAVNFTTSDQQFKIYSNYIQGIYGAGYLGKNNGYSAVSEVGVAEIGFKTAKLAGFCAITHQSFPAVGMVSLVITAGVPVKASFSSSALTTTDGAGQPITLDANGQLAGPSAASAVTITDMYLNTPNVTGYGNKIAGLNLGQNATTVHGSAGLVPPTGGGGATPVAGNFGLFSHFLNLSGFDGGTYGVDLEGEVNLPNLRLRVHSGAVTQSVCPTQAAS